MSSLLVNLRGVPEDEAEEIRQLLAEHAIDFFETPPGNWGISMPAIWVTSEADRQKAEPLLAEYQQQRYRAARAAWEQARKAQRPSLFQPAWWRALPLKLLYLALIAGILYLSVKPFLIPG